MLTAALILLAFALAMFLAVAALIQLGRTAKGRNLLMDRDKQPSSGGGPAFLPLQEFLEPRVQHVEQVKEQRLAKSDQTDP